MLRQAPRLAEAITMVKRLQRLLRHETSRLRSPPRPRPPCSVRPQRQHGKCGRTHWMVREHGTAEEARAALVAGCMAERQGRGKEGPWCMGRPVGHRRVGWREG